MPHNIHYRESKKFNDWVRLYTDKRNRDTYGNATQSALRAYETEDYSTAGVIGHKNIKKYKTLALAVCDQMGYGFGTLMEIGLKKMLSGKYKDWESLMQRLGYFNDKNSLKQDGSYDLLDFSNLGGAD